MAQLDFSLTDKVVLVTGAGRGIGKAIAYACAHAGADLALGSRTVSEIEQIAEEIRQTGRRAEAWQLDVVEVKSINRFVEQTIEAFGRINVVVNNAGYNKVQPALEFTEEEFDYIVDVNYKGTFFMSQAVAKRMIERGGQGSIINISSQVGVVGGPLRAPYSGAKGAVCQLTKSLAAEWATHGITVNAVGPTVTRTPLSDQAMQNPEFRKMTLEKILMGRLAEPEEIAAAVIYLASDAARMVTGQTLLVDGGWTAV
ncbi:MAG: 3-oxoacyl-ACP reductase FabG [Candidatus Poribacteria bacterium]|nr:3-oxoacyl-ACP reductase FabG [Candidatus Poribacteria bacterium]